MLYSINLNTYITDLHKIEHNKIYNRKCRDKFTDRNHNSFQAEALCDVAIWTLC